MVNDAIREAQEIFLKFFLSDIYHYLWENSEFIEFSDKVTEWIEAESEANPDFSLTIDITEKAIEPIFNAVAKGIAELKDELELPKFRY